LKEIDPNILDFANATDLLPIHQLEKIKEEIIDPPNKLPPILEGVVVSDEQKALIDAKEVALKEAIEQYNNISSEKFKYSDNFILKDFIDDFFDCLVPFNLMNNNDYYESLYYII
jgi:hypothetical protein